MPSQSTVPSCGTGETFDSDLGDVAAKTAIAVDQRSAGAGARRRQRCGEPSGPLPTQHIVSARHPGYGALRDLFHFGHIDKLYDSVN